MPFPVNGLRLSLLVLAWPLCLLPTAHAAETGPADLARKARQVLHANCYRCHGQDGSVEGGMNYVLDLKALIARRKVVPGDPARSRLFKRVVSSSNPMPPEEEKVRPGKEDVESLRRWIEAGAPDLPAPVARREFLSEARVLAYISADLQTIDERARRHTRYFTIAPLANAGLSEDELQTYRNGLSKLVNSLSWAPEIVVPRTIDPGRTVFRIDLREYRWDAALWQRIVEHYPYGIRLPGPTARAVYAATECEMPCVRADWFVFAASRPPLYHDVLRLPGTDRELEQELKVDVEADLQQERVARAGFNGSGVSQNNRLIERHTTGYGAFWKSYDFASNAGRKNLFAHPLGPGEEENAFQQDGGEIIFNLPNGLQGYMLVDARGNRLDEGPTRIVSVKTKANPAVINGVSCMFCHARGVIDKADQVRGHVQGNPGAFPAADSQVVRALYPPEADFKALLQKDAERFRKAAEAAGARPGGTEPVAALAERFEAELDLSAAAAEAGLAPETLRAGLDRFPEIARRLGPLRTEGGTVKREVFVAAFDDLVRAFNLGVSLHAVNQAIAEATTAIRLNPGAGRAYLDRGNAFFDKEDFARAIADYSEAIRLGRRGPEIYQNRGMARATSGDLDGAVADYTESIRLDDRDPAAYHNRALAHAGKGDNAAALADLTRAVELNPRDASALADRGLVHGRLGAHDKAIEDFSAALRLQPQSALLLARRGDAYRAAGKPENAAADYDRALQLDPGFAKAHNELARLCATCPEAGVRDGRKAVEHATRACELTGWKDTECLDTLAAALAESGRFEEAVRREKEALGRAPEGQQARFQARLELFQAGKPFREPSR